MKSQLKLLTLFLCIAVTLFTVVIVVNQTAQAVQLASTINPAFGRAVLFSLLVIYAAVVVVPVVLIWRLPKALTPPDTESSPEFPEYLKQLGARLEKNPNLNGKCDRLTNRENILGA